MLDLMELTGLHSVYIKRFSLTIHYMDKWPFDFIYIAVAFSSKWLLPVYEALNKNQKE